MSLSLFTAQCVVALYRAMRIFCAARGADGQELLHARARARSHTHTHTHTHIPSMKLELARSQPRDAVPGASRAEFRAEECGAGATC